MLVMLSAGWWSAILPSGANKLCFLGKRPWRGGGGGKGNREGRVAPSPRAPTTGIGFNVPTHALRFVFSLTGNNFLVGHLLQSFCFCYCSVVLPTRAK